MFFLDFKTFPLHILSCSLYIILYIMKGHCFLIKTIFENIKFINLKIKIINFINQYGQYGIIQYLFWLIVTIYLIFPGIVLNAEWMNRQGLYFNNNGKMFNKNVRVSHSCETIN